MNNTQKKIIVVSTVLDNLGIQQYSIEIVRILKKLNYDVLFFVPNKKNIIIPNDVFEYTVKYDITNNLMEASYRIVVKEIERKNPDLTLFTSDAIYTYGIALRLSRIGIKYAYVIHNVVDHPRHNSGIKKMLYTIYKRVIQKLLTYELMYKASHIVLLSQNSYKLFEKRYKKFSDKGVLMRLIPHAISDASERPPEMIGCEGYYLCFGSIDKYKNIEGLIRDYIAIPNNTAKLVISGKGSINQNERELANNDSRFILINRYTSNEEMNWLFINCKCVILPYIEASQSGVMNLAFMFEKPVIATRLEAFSYEIIDGKNGYMYDSKDELLQCFEKISNPKIYENMRMNIIKQNEVNNKYHIVDSAIKKMIYS